MEPKDLSDAHRRLLACIEKGGAVSPSQLAADTMTLPQAAWNMLNDLAALGLVVIRDDPDSADGTLAFAAPMAEDFTKGL